VGLFAAAGPAGRRKWDSHYFRIGVSCPRSWRHSEGTKPVFQPSELEVLLQRHDLEQVRALLGHARNDTTQVYASIRPPELKRAVAFYAAEAVRMLTD
jgi:integrase